jgi:hypothetical protein
MLKCTYIFSWAMMFCFYVRCPRRHFFHVISQQIWWITAFMTFLKWCTFMTIKSVPYPDLKKSLISVFGNQRIFFEDSPLFCSIGSTCQQTQVERRERRLLPIWVCWWVEQQRQCQREGFFKGWQKILLFRLSSPGHFIVIFTKGARICFFKSPQIANPQILGLNPLSQICKFQTNKFLRWASPQIAKPKISTLRQREWNIYFKKLPPFIAKLPKKFSRRFEHFKCIFVRRKIKSLRNCGSLGPQKNLVSNLQMRKPQKNIG